MTMTVLWFLVVSSEMAPRSVLPVQEWEVLWTENRNYFGYRIPLPRWFRYPVSPRLNCSRVLLFHLGKNLVYVFTSSFSTTNIFLTFPSPLMSHPVFSFAFHSPHEDPEKVLICIRKISLLSPYV